MKRKVFCILTAAVLTICLTVPAFADDPYYGQEGYYATFKEGTDGKPYMDYNFSGTDRENDTMEDVIKEYMEPGDTAIFSIDLKNEYKEEVDWYMENKVLYSLEDRSKNDATAGGGYTYELVYESSTGNSRTLFSNQNVGGENTSDGEGLWEVTHNLQKADDENFFYLDSYKTGQGGKLKLTVSLDGESQGNDYQDTLADLAMNFAVELADANPPSTTQNPNPTTTTPNAKTGDQANTTLYFVILFAAGAVILCLAILTLIKRRREDEA